MGKESLEQLIEYKNQIARLGLEACSLFETCMHLIKGSVVTKYTYKCGKKQEKEIMVSSDLLYFQWKPVGSSRSLRKFPVFDIMEVTPGNSHFDCKNHSDIKKDQESLCFTVHLRQRPVNIVAESDRQRDIWVTGLRFISKPDKANLQEEILKYDTLINEMQPKIEEELMNNEKDMFKSNESSKHDDNENIKLKKRIKELEKTNNKLTKEIFEINTNASKDATVGNELKKIIRAKEKSEKKLQSQLELVNLQFETQEKECTQKILNFEERLSQKDNRLLEIQTEYDEFKKQIKESFNRTLVQKVQQYRESKEVMCSYVNFLKERLDMIEKEVALWQAVVHSHVLPIYQSKKPGKLPQFKQVLEFALDNMERKLLTDRSQTQFMSLLTEARKNVKA